MGSIVGRLGSAGGGTVGHLVSICAIAAEIAASADWLPEVGCDGGGSRYMWLASSFFFIRSIAAVIAASSD